MSPTVHKVLMHGAQVISDAILPIGQLSEEAAEARNKHFRKYRVDFARKFSRIDCNRDVLNRLLLTSDPMISCNNKNEKRKSRPFSKEALRILVSGAPEIDTSRDSNMAPEDNISDSD